MRQEGGSEVSLEGRHTTVSDQLCLRTVAEKTSRKLASTHGGGKGRHRWGWSLSRCPLDALQICRGKAQPVVRSLCHAAAVASTDSLSRLPSRGNQALAHCRMGSNGWLHPCAARCGLHPALPLGAHVNGTHCLRMRGARREPGPLPVDGLGASPRTGQPTSTSTCPSGWPATTRPYSAHCSR